MLEGKYLGRVGGLGHLAIFLQTPMGLLLFVVTPLCLFIIYDMLVRRRGKKSSREAELEAELAALRAAQGDNKESKAAVEDETGAMTINSSTKGRTPTGEVSS
jgi:hypothetical protein